MAGGLLQLAAYGAQDVYLTGNPQITYFKAIYRRHTNFSTETMDIAITGTKTLTTSETSCDCTIQNTGDLLGKLYITSETAGITSGDKIIKEIEFQIGQQIIDKHTREWMQLWNELTIPESKADGFKYMTGCTGSSGTTGPTMVQIPLLFWFCRNPGLALPLIALNNVNSDIKLSITWGTSTEVGAAAVCKVAGEYIFLDTEERRRFSQVSHEYLIEQIQIPVTTPAANTNYELALRHPVKEIIWTDAAGITTQKALLNFNNSQRFAKQSKEYFQLRHPYDFHTSIPRQNIQHFSEPVLLPTPVNVSTIMLTNEADTSISDGGMSVVSNVLYLHSDEAQSGFEIGDILHIKEIDDDADAAAGFDVFATITTVTSTTQFTLNSCPNTVAGNWGSVSKIGSTKTPLCRTSTMTNNINCYSFSIEPESHQPSGTCNFSKIQTAELVFDSSATIQNVYAINYNILRINSGQAGIAYST
jgi:hypothetical protein